MIINSLSMKNFQCYYGEHESNKLNFTDGLNLIIGDNGGGKSKLFDAFYWVIYDQIFLSDTRRMVSTEQYKDSLISDKAKSECQVGESVVAEVIIEAKSTQERIYKLTRIYKAKKLGEKDWEVDRSSQLLISEYIRSRWELVSSEKHDSYLQRVIPRHLKPYMWFQGEQVDSLMDLTDSSALLQIVNLLSGIEDYKQLVEIANQGANKTTNDLIKAQKTLSKNKDQSDQLGSTISQAARDMEKHKNDIESYEKELETAKIKIEELISQIQDAEKKAEYKAKKKTLERRSHETEERLNAKRNKLPKKVFQECWILKNAAVSFSKFEKKYNNYLSAHNKRESDARAVKIQLPLNVPQPIHVKTMLEKESCFVCGREAKKDSEAYKHIRALLEREEAPKDLFVNDFSNKFSAMYSNNVGFKHLISNIDDSILTELKSIEGLQTELQNIKREIAEINKQFDVLIEDDQSEDILKAYKTHENNRDKYDQLLDGSRRGYERAQGTYSQAKAKLEGLMTGDVDAALTKAELIFKQLVQVTTSTKDQVFSDLLNELESSANDIFIDMTKTNQSVRGKIKFRKAGNESYIPEIVDTDGYIINSPNDSNIILIKLSLIMAILTLRAKWSENYALISDAPTSKMADNYTYGFYKTLSKRFKQSIITTYDFLDDEGKSILRDFNIGNIYQIEPGFPSSDRDNRSELSVKIRAVNL